MLEMQRECVITIMEAVRKEQKKQETKAQRQSPKTEAYLDRRDPNSRNATWRQASSERDDMAEGRRSQQEVWTL